MLLPKSIGDAIREPDRRGPAGIHEDVDAVDQRFSQAIVAEDGFVVCQALADEPYHDVDAQRLQLESLTSAACPHDVGEETETKSGVSRQQKVQKLYQLIGRLRNGRIADPLEYWLDVMDKPLLA